MILRLADLHISADTDWPTSHVVLIMEKAIIGAIRDVIIDITARHLYY